LSELEQGLTLSGLGILITFSALGILIGLISLLKAFFPAREVNKRNGEARSPNPPAASIERDRLRKQAAAVGVGVLIKGMSRSPEGDLGKLLEEPPADWWRKGVDRVHGKE
jgi:hypothetical protein